MNASETVKECREKDEERGLVEGRGQQSLEWLDKGRKIALDLTHAQRTFETHTHTLATRLGGDSEGQFGHVPLWRMEDGKRGGGG